MRTNGNTDMQPRAALMSMDDQAKVVEAALRRTTKNMVLVQDSDTRICWRNGQLIRYRPKAGRSWTCRKITPLQLVKLAPAQRVLEILNL